MPFKATTSGLKTGFTPSTASQLSPHACRFGAAAPHATPAAAATPLATGASPEMMPGRANNYIPVSLGGPASAAADGGAPAGHHHTLLSPPPLVTQAFAIDAACNTADVTRRLGWDTATPERPRDGDMRAQDVSALFKRGAAAAADAISPTVPFMAAMSKASIEDTLQFLVQSDLPTRPKSRPAPQVRPPFSMFVTLHLSVPHAPRVARCARAHSMIEPALCRRRRRLEGCRALTACPVGCQTPKTCSAAPCPGLRAATLARCSPRRRTRRASTVRVSRSTCTTSAWL